MTTDFSAQMRRRRRELDLTRSELALLVGCSPDTIKKIETGERRPSKQLAGLLARHLQIEEDAVAGFVVEARKRPGGLSPPGNLPTPLTGLFGREQETTQVCDAILTQGARLVTLTGPPGVGKSRLALHCAAQLAAEFADGVWLLSCTPLPPSAGFYTPLAQLLGLPDGTRAKPWLFEHLRDRRLLVLLDDFDALTLLAADLTELLTACGQVVALVTSAAPLRAYGEQRVPIPPLPVPDNLCPASLPQLAENAAAQLFVARVRAHRAEFRLTHDNAPIVAEICRRLDGIPLAIELAAGRADAASPQILLSTIQASGRLDLTPDQYDYTPHLRSLRSLIAGSIERLAPDDQSLLAGLGVFHGPFDTDIAWSVVVDRQPPATWVEARLTEMADRGLIQRVYEGDGIRFRLLETLREAAQDRLGDSAATLRLRHARYCTELVAGIDPAQTLGNISAWRGNLRQTSPDLIAALAFLTQTGADPDATLQLAVGLGHFWYLEGDWEYGADRLVAVLAIKDGTPGLLARVGAALGILYRSLGRYTDAVAVLDTAYRQAERAQDGYAQAWTLSQQVHLHILQGNHAHAGALSRTRLDIVRTLHDDRYLAIALEQAGLAAVEHGDYAQGIPWLLECLERWIAQQSPGGSGTARAVLGMAALAQGDAETALAFCRAAQEDFTAGAQAHGLAWGHRNLALALLALGDLAGARASLRESLDRYRAMQSANGPIIVVEATAAYAWALGDRTAATRLAEQAAAQRIVARLPLSTNAAQVYARLLPDTATGTTPHNWTEALALTDALLRAPSDSPSQAPAP